MLKPCDAASLVTAEKYLTSLPVSSVCRQAGCGLTITNLKAEFPKALLVAVRLQPLAFVWKLFFNMLATVQVTSEGLFSLAEHELVLLETRILEKRDKLVNIAVGR